MAFFKYPEILVAHQSPAFDALYSPGDAADNAGIYRCNGCGHEIGIAKHHTLPPQSHHVHPNSLVPIKWQLIVCADQK
jgi:hypothetical protein